MHRKIRTAAVNFTETQVLQMHDAKGNEIGMEPKKFFFLWNLQVKLTNEKLGYCLDRNFLVWTNVRNGVIQNSGQCEPRQLNWGMSA